MIKLALPRGAGRLTAAPSVSDARFGRAPVPTAPRVAIVHDWFQGFHGSERVVEAMRADVFREADVDIFTFFAAHELLPGALDQAIVQESRLAQLPGIRQRGHARGRWRNLLPYMPRYFRGLDLEPYDAVVYSSHSCAVHARARDGAPTVCYCHTPMRYAWMPETDADRAPGAAGWALGRLSTRLRRLDLEASRHVDQYVANSSAVQERIRRFYGRDSEVIHPPVDVADLDPHREREPGSFLWVHRLVPYKRPEFVVEAFRGLPFRLTMVGVGPLEQSLRGDLPPNVELRGWVSREELTDLYATASGFIHVAEEDFGITMVEALAAGAPVLALNRGGARDIVRDGTDGTLVQTASVEAIRRGVNTLAQSDWDRDALRARAMSFSRDVFVNRFRALVDSVKKG
jgi:glycosyltransferase involved in cell wall biosynthesis